AQKHCKVLCFKLQRSSLFVNFFRKCSMVDQATKDKLEAGFQKLQASPECHSLLKKYLTREVLDQLKDKKTAMGATLLDVVQSGKSNTISFYLYFTEALFC